MIHIEIKQKIPRTKERISSSDNYTFISAKSDFDQLQIQHSTDDDGVLLIILKDNQKAEEKGFAVQVNAYHDNSGLTNCKTFASCSLNRK